MVKLADLGVFGLSTMGANLARNAARKGFGVAVYNRHGARTDELIADHGSEGRFAPAKTIADFVAALDSVNAESVMHLLHEACKNAGMTAVVVTHDAQLASWADRVLFLRDGRVTDQTAPAPGPESLLVPEGKQ